MRADRVQYGVGIAIFALAVVLFFALLNFLVTSSLVDPDSFYHLKFSRLLQHSGWEAVMPFPWATVSVWQIYPVDLSLGYHYLLAAFLAVIRDPLVAMKLLGTLASASVVIASLFIMRHLQVPFPLLWSSLLVVGSSSFLFRVSVVRPVILSITFLLLGFLFSVQRRPALVGLVGFLHALAHISTIPFLLFVVGVTSLITSPSWRNRLLLLSAVVSGVSLGVVLRPDFPEIIPLVAIQDWYVLVHQWTGAGLSEGQEVHPLGVSGVLVSSFLIVFMLLVSLAIFLRYSGARPVRPTVGTREDRTSRITIALLILALTFLPLAVVARRFVEYWVPFAVLFAALAMKPYLERFDARVFFRRWWTHHKLPLVLGGTLLFWIVFSNISSAFTSLKAAEPLEKFRDAAQWLAANTPEKSVVFHTDWDDFPKLFYFNDHNYYLVGLDPTFMYVYDQNLYWLWRNISDWGVPYERPLAVEEINKVAKLQDPAAVAEAIRTRFRSEVLFVPHERALLKIFLVQNPEYFAKVYEDKWAGIYFVRPNP